MKPLIINGKKRKTKETIDTRLEGHGYFHFKHFYDQVAVDAPPDATVIEIGVLHGHSLIYLKELRPDLDLIGVDWGRGAARYAPYPTAGTLAVNLAKRNLQVPILMGDSSSMARFIPDKSVWLVFVDADHTEEGIRKDIAAWAPKVMDGGIIAGDDYGDPGWPDVKKVVDELYPHREVRGTTWIVRG